MPTPTKVKLTGGAFQDSEGNVLSYGYLEFVLSQDGSVSGVGQIASGITIKVILDANGDVEGTAGHTLTSVASAVSGSAVYTGTITGGDNNAFAGLTFVITGFATSANNGTFTCTASSATTLTLSNASASAETHAGTATASQAVWGNDQLSPVNSYYRVTGYTSAGQPAWGPNNQQVTGSGGSFDIGTWVPNQVISWTPTVVVGPEFQIDGTDLTDQDLVNFISSANTPTDQGGSISWIDNGDGSITAFGPGFFTDSVLNEAQDNLNLVAGVGIDLTNAGTGVTIDVTNGQPTGGSTGQVLTKNSNTDYDSGWATPSVATGGLPMPQDAQFSLWVPNGSVVPYFNSAQVWKGLISSVANIFGSGGVTGSSTSPDANFGYAETLVVGSTSTGRTLGDGNWVYPGRAGKFITRLVPYLGLADYRFYVGLYNQTTNLATADPAAVAAVPTNAMMFFFNKDISNNWQFFVSNGSGSYTLHDTAVPASTSSFIEAEFDWDGSGNVTVTINGSNVGNLTTSDFTPTTTAMSMALGIGGSGHSTGTGVRVAMVYAESEY